MKTWVIITMCIVLLLGLSFMLGYTSVNPYYPVSDNSSYRARLPEDEDPLEPRLIANISFFGNMFWGRYIHDWSMASEWKYRYPFLGLHEMEKKPHEFWVSGLECPIADANPTSSEQESVLKFNCREEYLPYVAPWIDAFTLANNHTDNYEEINGFASTQQKLQKYGIEHFGSFDNRKDAICKVLSIPFMNSVDVAQQVPIAFCGYHWVFGVPTPEQLSEIRNYASKYITIVLPHGGAEYVSTPDELKTSLYRQMVDLGADMVIGDHPHTVQTTEVYKDKLIAYSLGNFLFDQQSSFATTRSLSVRSVIRLPQGYTPGTKPKMTIEYSARCTDDSQKKFKRAARSDCEKIIAAAQWKFAVEY